MNCTSPVNRKYRTKDSSPYYSNTRDLTGEQKDTIQHRQLRLRPRQLLSSQQSLSRSRMVGTADETRAYSLVSKDPRESHAQLPHRLHTLERSAQSIRRQHTGTCRNSIHSKAPGLLSLSKFHTLFNQDIKLHLVRNGQNVRESRFQN